MLLGDFETVVFWLKAPSQRSSTIWPEIAEFGTACNLLPMPFYLVQNSSNCKLS
jgi:hypothetical protein